MPDSEMSIPYVRLAQVAPPSALSRRAPPSPEVVHVSDDEQAIASKRAKTPEERLLQCTPPSALVRMVPPSPTAIHRALVGQTMPYSSSLVPVGRACQTVPTAEPEVGADGMPERELDMMVPSHPTARQAAVLGQVMALRPYIV
jgi:hypothetical protein